MSGLKGFVVAGTHSGCGKTSVTLGLLAALSRRGLAVQPFKAGPDFIDPGLHALAAGKPSHNLDSWMIPEPALSGIFARHAADADVAVVEGVMGLFDGFSAEGEAGSTAELAKVLGLPVVLVADARSMARSAAALVSGFASFDPELSLAGVVFNNVGSPAHADTLRRAMAAAGGVPVLGCLPRDPDLALPSRHLGLVTAQDQDALPERIQRLADLVEGGLDLPALLDALPPVRPEPVFDTLPLLPEARIGVARDRAFCFYYQENLRLLRQAGAELVFFSPLADKRLPEGLDGLYLGGGYPELSAFDLAQNVPLKRDILAFSREGRPVYAECGGFLYLMAALSDPGGRRFPMTEVFPFRAAMSDRRAALGYREVATTAESLLGPAGTTARGHEFHYSFIEEPDPSVPAIYEVSGRTGPLAGPEGFLLERTLGSYVHLHFASNPEIPARFVALCRSLRP